LPDRQGSLQETATDDATVIHTGSISSSVDLDLVHNEAHKIYHPSFPVRLLYWLAFQATFPYIDNHAALEAARLRRVIVDLLTKVWFGHHLVARVVDITDLPEGGHDFVTRLVRGHEPENRDAAKTFLKQLDQRFLEAGLPTWQTTPYNPHAITNFIEANDGSYRIIDLESSLVAFLYPVSRVVGLVRLGQFPSFDDIDVPRLRSYVEEHSQVIDNALPPGERDILDAAIAAYDELQDQWHRSERRYLPRALRFAFRLVDVPSWVRGLRRLGARSEEIAESYVREGIDEWVQEGRLTKMEADAALTALNAPPVAYAMLHLGAHFAISIPLRFPFGALARFAYTIAMRLGAEASSLLGRHSVHEARRTHTVTVALVSLLPGLGRLAYLFAEPLRTNRLLLLVPFDRVMRKLPARLYDQLHLQVLVDSWALPGAAAAEHGLQLSRRVRQLTAHGAMMLAIVGLNSLLLAWAIADEGGGGERWFAQRGVLHTAGVAQAMLGSAVAGAAFGGFWRVSSQTRPDAAGIFLWAGAALWVTVLALDDFVGIHAALGDFLGEYVPGAGELVDGLAVFLYGVSAVCGLYLFRHEVLAVRASSTLLIVGLAALAVVGGLQVASEATIPVDERLMVTAPVAGLWLLAAGVRMREVRVRGVEG
jgi:hypothetical protein